MLDVFLEGRKQEVLGDEGGELLQVELRHMPGETHEAPSPVVLERPDRTVILGFLGVEHDKGDKPSSKALAEHDDAARPAVAVEERMDALIEYVETDDVSIRGAGAFAIRFEETGDRLIDIRQGSGCNAPNTVGHRLPLARAFSILQRSVKPFDQVGGERLIDGIERETEYAEMVAHLDDVDDGHRGTRGDGSPLRRSNVSAPR